MALSSGISAKVRLAVPAAAIGGRPRHVFAGLLVAALAVYLVAHVALLYAKLDFGASGPGGSEATDFFEFYSAAHMLAEMGDAATLYDPRALTAAQIDLGGGPDGLHPFNYPPPYIGLVWPFAALPYAAALICWQWIGLGAFALSLWGAGLRRLEILAGIAAPASALNFAPDRTDS